MSNSAKETCLTPSDMDIEHLSVIRANVRSLMNRVAQLARGNPGLILEVGPTPGEDLKAVLGSELLVHTLDITRTNDPTFVGDICRHNPNIDDSTYDYVIAAEVLEHTMQPFFAVDEIFRVMKPGGMLFLSVPYNFRIHGPLPDCWRFTEHGIRAMLNRFCDIEIGTTETPGRPLMPIHYVVVARKPT
jgi:SAM-dependent methyltransferase